MSSLSQNEISLICHLTAIHALSSSISIQHALIFIQYQRGQAPNLIHSVQMSNAIKLTSYSPVGPVPSIPPVVKNSEMTPRA